MVDNRPTVEYNLNAGKFNKNKIDRGYHIVSNLTDLEMANGACQSGEKFELK